MGTWPSAAALVLLVLLQAAGPVGASDPLAGPDPLRGPDPGRGRGSGAEAPADFGRWERGLRRCRLQRSPATEPGGGAALSLVCRGMRLDQQVQGLMSVRFLAAAATPGLLPGQLAFAGVLEPGSRPMRCQQGRCQPRWPIRLRVSALARSGLVTGPAASLLQAQLAQGQCDLSARLLRCSARSSQGETWSAEAQP